MQKFKELFEKSVWEQKSPYSMVKSFSSGLVIVYADENDYRIDITDKQGNIKEMGNQFKDKDDFIDFLVSDFGFNWRTRDSEVLSFIEQSD